MCAEHSAKADLVIVAGTSATVYPAAGFALEVKERGGILVEVNLYDSEITQICDVSLRGGSAEVLPRLVKAVGEMRRAALSSENKEKNLIGCETRRGFHTSLGTGDPCTRYQENRHRCGMRDFVPVRRG